MPAFQTYFLDLNKMLGSEGLADVDAELFAPGADIVEVSERAGLVRSKYQAAFMRTVPEGLVEAMRALVYSNLKRETRLPMTFTWMPGYDYELTISEVAGTPESPGGITVVLRTRYPADDHPLNKRPARAAAKKTRKR